MMELVFSNTACFKTAFLLQKNYDKRAILGA